MPLISKFYNNMPRNFQALFEPKSIAIIGANSLANTVGSGLAKNVLEGKGHREIYFVNPNEAEIFGIKTHKSLSDIGEAIDLAVIAVPAKIVPAIVNECIENSVGAVIIISAGFAETGTEGQKIQESLVAALKKANIPLLGPNCLGVLNPWVELNASFAPASPKAGEIALISQSGAMIDSIIDVSLAQNYGFSKIISIGNEGDINLSELILACSKDPQTKVIGIYIEGINNGREFVKVCQEVSQTKPIVIIKAGKGEAGKKAASTHTGSLAGEYVIYQAAFHKAGVIEAQSVEELLDLCKALAWQPRFNGKIGIVTNGGGVGVLTADACQEFGLELASLDDKTLKTLEAPGVMHPAWSKANPVDVVGDATAQKYESAISALLDQKDISALIVLQTMQIMTNSIENANITAHAAKRHADKPIVCCFLGGKMTLSGINVLEENKIPNFSDPRKAANILAKMKNK